MSDRIYNVLFLCTGNTARSVLAEGILRKDGAGRFRAFSAGSHPKGHGQSVRAQSPGCTTAIRRTDFDRRTGTSSPRLARRQMDFVFTVCDSAAGETCPIWPGQPMTAHWGIEDPAAVEGKRHRERARIRQALSHICATASRPSSPAAREPRQADAQSAAPRDRPARRSDARCVDGELRSRLRLRAPSGRGARHGAAGRNRRRLRHHGRDADAGQCGRAARQHTADRRDPGGVDHHPRADFRRAFQSGGVAGVRAQARIAVARSGASTSRPRSSAALPAPWRRISCSPCRCSRSR